MKKKIAIWICMALTVSAAAFTGYKTYQHFVTPDFLTENIEVLTNNEANVTLSNCYDSKSIVVNDSSAEIYVICPDGTTDYKIGDCILKKGRKKAFASLAGKCIEK